MAFRASQLLLRRPPRHGALRLGRASIGLHALLALLPGLSSCTDLTRPPPHRRLSSSAIAALTAAAASAPRPLPAAATAGATAPAAAAEPPALPREQPVPSEPASPAGSGGAPREQIGASHILVSYRDATRAKPTVTRTKEEARQLAEQLAERARQPGTDFAQLAREASDGPTGIEGGALPKFGRQQMVKPFSDAAFALQPGQISGVVETNFGFHIIKRTE